MTELKHYNSDSILSSFFPNLPEVVGSMMKLRWVSCSRYPGTPLPREFQPMELCYLELRESMLEQLWEGYKHLPNLKVLDLSDSNNLIITPDFDGLPCLERLILKDCTGLKEIHPSIGRHESLIYVDMGSCNSLEIFPPIIRMKKLETLILSDCCQLCKFPEIQTNMDNLIKLCLRGNTKIKCLPSSVGQYCTNLRSLDLRNCSHLESIEGNFRLLKHLKRLKLDGSGQLKIPAEGLVDVECCLDVLSLSRTSFRNLHRGAMNIKLPGSSHFLRRLSLRWCDLVDKDISSLLWKELSNLQVLDLSGNNFSRLHSSLSQLPRLKFLDFSWYSNLVELPDLPSSIAILIAERCWSLTVVGDLPANLKWLWKATLSNIYDDNGKRLVQSFFQGNAIEDYFISLYFHGTIISTSGLEWGTFMLQLPCNWYNEFSGFLIQTNHEAFDCTIRINDVMDRENAVDVLEVSDEIDQEEERGITSRMCYISFGWLRHTSWWNPTRTIISFSLPFPYLKVELVPRRNQGGYSIETAKDATNSSEYWDEESSYRNTFQIIHDSKSSIEIQWWHDMSLS